METSLKTGFAQVFSCCPKNLSCPNFGGAAAPLAPPARTPMSVKTSMITISLQTALSPCCREYEPFHFCMGGDGGEYSEHEIQ